ncbi:glycosyltransferase family 39 protein, partial [Candidatus Roizmanbacteria bacterium]|nr:glycosyltransferase family 39 protein [Candidatus Roizmanbacteria bacterium]
MSRKDVVILFIILFLALIFRLYRISSPLADLHSWRQADTAAVARNFVKNGIDLFHPRYDDLSGRESGRENPQGYRMVEFPIYNAIIAFIYKLAPLIPVEVYGRLTTTLFSLVTIAIIYYLVFRENGSLTAIIASLTYAVFPFFVFFSRVVLPETTALASTFISILFLYLYKEKKISPFKEFIYFIGSVVFFALA